MKEQCCAYSLSEVHNWQVCGKLMTRLPGELYVESKVQSSTTKCCVPVEMGVLVNISIMKEYATNL